MLALTVFSERSQVLIREHCQPSVASLPEADVWVNQHALTPFFSEVREERVTELDRIAEHIELSLTEVLQCIDLEIGRAAEEAETHVTGAEGRLAQRPKPATTGRRPGVTAGDANSLSSGRSLFKALSG